MGRNIKMIIIMIMYIAAQIPISTKRRNKFAYKQKISFVKYCFFFFVDNDQRMISGLKKRGGETPLNPTVFNCFESLLPHV